MTRDKISIDRAYELDNDWMNGTGDDGLRIVSYYKSGNRSVSVLCIPGGDNAPRYEYRTHSPDTGEYAPAYYHVSGPTLDEWQQAQELAEMRQERQDAADLYAWASGR